MSGFTAIIVILIAFYIISKVIKNFFIKSLDNISDWLKLSPSVEGATLMAFGTSAPEFAIAMIALFLPGDHQSTGLGSVVGSALFNTLVVIGFAAVIHKSTLEWKVVLRDGFFYLVAIILLIVGVRDGVVTQAESLMFIVAYLFYLAILFLWSNKVSEKDEPDSLDIVDDEINEDHPTKFHSFMSVLTEPIDNILSIIPDVSKKTKWTIPVFVISLVFIGLCSYLLVFAAESLGKAIGIPSAIISLTILAGGSSLPELVSSAIVAKEGRGPMAVSNALGSNVFNVLFGFGFPVFLWTLVDGNVQNVGEPNIETSIILMFATLIVLIALLTFRHFKVGKIAGIFLILLYVFYVFAAYSGLIERILLVPLIHNLI